MPFVACSPEATPWPKRAPRISGSPLCAARAAGRAGSRPRASAPAPAAKPATRLRRVSVVIAAHGAALRVGDEPQCRPCAASLHWSPSCWPWPASPRCAPGSSPAPARRATPWCERNDCDEDGGGQTFADQSCDATRTSFRSVRVIPAGRGLRFSFTRRVDRQVTIDVFQTSVGRRVLNGRRLVRIVTDSSPKRWSGRAARDGLLFARFRIVDEQQRVDTRRVTLRRRGGRFRVVRPFHRAHLVRDGDRLQARRAGVRRPAGRARSASPTASPSPGASGSRCCAARRVVRRFAATDVPRVPDPAPARGRARACAAGATRSGSRSHPATPPQRVLPLRSEAVSGPLSPPFIADLPLTCEALEYAVERHEGQRRDSDAAPFILHPLEVAVLLRNRGYGDEVVAAGLLHDAVEDTDATAEEIAGPLRRPRRRARRRAQRRRGRSRTTPSARRRCASRSRRPGEEAAAIYAADKVAKARELRAELSRDPPALDEPDVQARLEHYEESLAMLERVLPGQRASAPAALRALGAADAPAAPRH